MRRGKMGSQLGAHQKYYISRCEKKQSIQLTITVVGDDKESVEERRSLINDVTEYLDDIMKVFMPATTKKPSLLIPCPFCPKLHILLDDSCSGKAVFCPNVDDKALSHGYYNDLLQGELATTITGRVVITNYWLMSTLYIFVGVSIDKKLKVFTDYYYKLTHLNFKELYPLMVTAKILSYEDSQIVQHTTKPSEVAFHVLGKIYTSLRIGIHAMFDEFLSVLENYDDLICIRLAEEMRRDLSNITTGIFIYNNLT